MPGEDQPQKQKLKPSESLAVGVVTGWAAASVYMPFFTLKMRYQTGMPFSVDPRILYKGFGTALGMVLPITTLQIFTASSVENATTTGDTVSPTQRMGAAFCGGASAGVPSNFINLAITQQHKNKHPSTFSAAKTLMQQGPQKMFVGLPVSALGEGAFACAYFGMVPAIKPYVKKYVVDNELAASITSGVLAGVPIATATQPLDRVKTMQHKLADAGSDEQGSKHSPTRCMKELYKNEGLRVGFFKGLVPRGLGLVAVIAAKGATAEYAQNYFGKG